LALTELRVQCDEARADELSDALLEAGALSVSVEDAEAGSGVERPIFGEPGAEPSRVWRLNRLVALIAAGDDAAAILARAAQACAMPAPPFSAHALADEDWVRKTQSQFDPIRITPNLWIVPSWHQAPDPRSIVIRLDPGLAFGTGSHPTTRLCLRWLAQAQLAGRGVIDYGCGSGILGIAACKLGAARVTASDIDPGALSATRDNARANACTLEIVEPGSLGGRRADVVVANILTNPLKVLAPALAGHVERGGCLTLSGILDSQADEVIEAYAPYIRLLRFDSDEGWVCLSGTMSR
jgi:ribosomal protein L11 methyltransferase